MMRRFAAAVVVALLMFAARAQAATCTVHGTATIQPLDNWYCDTGILGSTACSSWKQKDLKNATKALRYMRVRVLNSSGTIIADDITDSSGAYSMSWTSGSSCAGQHVTVAYVFARADEGHINASPQPYRFKVVDPQDADATWVDTADVALAAASTLHDMPYTNWSVNQYEKIANVYYIVDQAIGEMTTWSSGISANFSSTSGATGDVLKISYSPYVSVASFMSHSEWKVYLDGGAYAAGWALRHEIGHGIHFAIHDRWMLSGSQCYDLNFNNGKNWINGVLSPNHHSIFSCEFGDVAMLEAMADFFATRSVTSNNSQVWVCSCTSASQYIQDQCSIGVRDTMNGEGIGACSGFTGIWALGDAFTSGTSSCVRPFVDDNGKGCNCTPDSTGRCSAAFAQNNGFRNQLQVERFLWDLIDSTTDGGAEDDDLTIEDFVFYLERMPCVGAVGDGTCKEPHTSPCYPSDPATLIGTTNYPGTPHGSTRDAYNPWDIGDLLPLSQADVRNVNCVDQATD